MDRGSRCSRREFGSAVLTGTLLGSAAQAQKGDFPLPTVIERMDAAVKAKEVAGVVTLVANTARTIHLHATGWADVPEEVPLRPDSLFWIASMTKPITGTAVMMMQEAGKLSVDDPIGKYLPELSHLKTEDGKEHAVTIKQLLTHTSGMAEATAAEAAVARRLANLIPAYAARPLRFEPGSRWTYCQSSINTAARIVEVVSGQSFPEFLQTRLFDPLGMKDTGFYLTAAQEKRLSKSYQTTPGKDLTEVAIGLLAGKNPSDRDRYPAANGGLFSTAPDYGLFARMILNRGSLFGKQYLTPASVKQMTEIQTGSLTTGFTPGNGWGLGWCVIREPQGVTAMLNPGTAGHGGAYGTQAWIDFKRGVAYVLMVQRSNFPNADASDLRKNFQEAASQDLRRL